MSATDSEAARKSGPLPGGISGRVLSEWVADLRRNQWPAWVGIRTTSLQIGVGSVYKAPQTTAGTTEYGSKVVRNNV
jgi:hypothetical protein